MTGHEKDCHVARQRFACVLSKRSHEDAVVAELSERS